MPLYQYRCTQCGAEVERIQKFADAPLTRCEKCSGTLERLLSSPAIRFKGSGWYVTDYAHKPSGANSSKTSDSAKGEESAAKPTESSTVKSSKDD